MVILFLYRKLLYDRFRIDSNNEFDCNDIIIFYQFKLLGKSNLTSHNNDDHYDKNNDNIEKASACNSSISKM